MADPMEPRELTYDERATWGKCPVCAAAQDEWCNGAVGLSLGLSVAGLPPEHGVHLGRLSASPRKVRLVACS